MVAAAHTHPRRDARPVTDVGVARPMSNRTAWRITAAMYAVVAPLYIWYALWIDGIGNKLGPLIAGLAAGGVGMWMGHRKRLRAEQ